MKCKNPILPGFYPDPSICQAGEDYYLVNSTFVYFPGIPVFKSTDLVNWKQIGNVLDNPSGLHLEECSHSQGIYAPTLRYEGGKFYLTATNVGGGGNFLVTADTPSGPWSEPLYFGQEAPGIDPSLFFDLDGKCYYVGNRTREPAAYFGDCQIWLQELDLSTKKFVGNPTCIWSGFMKNAYWPEGPHLYRKNGYYYLLYAEGGTQENHCIAVARSRFLTGPYEGNPRNPILTHRHLGKDYPVTCTGHGDLVQGPDGNWYVVLLACRPMNGHTLLGRETFLAKVSWEDGWPVINPGLGHLAAEFELSWQASAQVQEAVRESYDFSETRLPLEMLTLRRSGNFLRPLEKGLFLPFVKHGLDVEGCPSYVCMRLRHWHWQVQVRMSLEEAEAKDRAGLALYQNPDFQIRLECRRRGNRVIAQVILRKNGVEEAAGQNELESLGFFYTKMEGTGLKGSFWMKGSDQWLLVASQVDLSCVSTETAGGFTGCTVGMFAQGASRNTKRYALFKEFSYLQRS